MGHKGFCGIDVQDIEAHNSRITTRTGDALKLWDSEYVCFSDNWLALNLTIGGNPELRIEYFKDKPHPMENADAEVCKRYKRIFGIREQD